MNKPSESQERKLDTSNNQKATSGNVNPQNQSLLTSTVPLDMKYPIISLSINLSWFIFAILLFVTFFSVMDGGIIPAKTTDIKKDLKIDNAQYGLFGSVEYIGRLTGALFFTITINKANRKYFLVSTLIFKGLLLMATYYIMDFAVLCVFRGLGGISQVFFMIYVPVWCDQYGPRKLRTMMITISQLCLPLGVTLGYGLSTFINSWVYAFVIEGAFLVILALIVIFIPKVYFSNTFVLQKTSDLQGREILQDATVFEVSMDRSHNLSLSYAQDGIAKVKKSLWNNLFFMFTEMIFIFTGLCNTVVNFVLAVIQFWAPEYMEKTLLITDENMRFYIFAMICITSPICGMSFSGILGSWVGGYKNRKSIYICLSLTITASLLGVAVSELTNVWLCVVILWVFCFCSYGKLPVEAGIIITSLPHHMRGDGYSVLNFFVNLLGNLPSSYVYGLLYDYFKDSSISNMAFKIIMYFNFFGLACLIVSTVFRLKMPVDLDETHIYPELPDEDIKNKDYSRN